MGRIYTVPWTGTITNAGGNADLWLVTPADDKPVRIRGIRLGQISEVADAQEEGLSLSIIHLAATVTPGSGGGAVTPVPTDVGVNVAAGFTARTNDTTVATSSGTATIVEELAWNERQSPLEIWYPDVDFAATARQAAALALRMNTTPADDLTFCGTLWVEEL
jgi:hypothetical protein